MFYSKFSRDNILRKQILHVCITALCICILAEYALLNANKCTFKYKQMTQTVCFL